MSYKKKELPALRENPSSSRFLLRFVLLILLVFFCVVLLCVFTFEFCVVMSVTISAENDVRFVSTSSCLEEA